MPWCDVETADGRVVKVNPHQVCYLRQERDKTVSIVFGASQGMEHALKAVAPMAELVAVLDASARSPKARA